MNGSEGGGMDRPVWDLIFSMEVHTRLPKPWVSDCGSNTDDGCTLGNLGKLARRRDTEAIFECASIRNGLRMYTFVDYNLGCHRRFNIGVKGEDTLIRVFSLAHPVAENATGSQTELSPIAGPYVQ